MLVLDGGDAVVTIPRAAGPVSEPEQGRAASMLRGLGLLGADALAIGEAELTLEQDLLALQARRSGVPLLAANLVDRRGRRPFLPRRLVERGGVKVGLFAVFEEPKGAPAAAGPRQLRTEDIVESARTQVAALRKEGAELIVLLAHVGMPRARELVTTVPGIHLGLVAHSGWRTNEPEAVANRTFLIEAGRRGQLLAHLEIRLGEGWRPELALVDDSRRHVLFLEASRELQQVRKLLAGPLTEATWRDRVKPQAERARLLARQLEQARPPATAHSLVSRLIELDENVPEQAAMKGMLLAARQPAVQQRAEPAPRMSPLRILRQKRQ